MHYGRSLHHLQLFTMSTFTFPEYMRKHIEAEERLGLRHSHDLLPVTWKLYIAIMAVSCYENSYLLVFLEEQFIQSGGNPEWLRGEGVERKVRRLADLNEVLAFRPWTLSLTHIEALLASEAPDIHSAWSIPELLHAGAILAHFHCLCGLLFSQGIKGSDALLPDVLLFWDS